MPPRPYYHAVAFDFDGTLVDTMLRYADIAAEQMAAHFGVDRSGARRMYLETSGIPFFQQLEQIFGLDERNSACAQGFEDRKAVFLETVSFDDTTRAAVARIRQLGLSIAITSNNFQSLVDRFVRQYPGLFDLVLGFSEGVSKGPVQFSRVRERFGIDRRHLLFVGDSLTDRRKAMAFGIDFVAVAGTIDTGVFQSLFPGTIVVEHLAELVELLERGTPINKTEKHQ